MNTRSSRSSYVNVLIRSTLIENVEYILHDFGHNDLCNPGEIDDILHDSKKSASEIAQELLGKCFDQTEEFAKATSSNDSGKDDEEDDNTSDVLPDDKNDDDEEDNNAEEDDNASGDDDIDICSESEGSVDDSTTTPSVLSVSSGSYIIEFGHLPSNTCDPPPTPAANVPVKIIVAKRNFTPKPTDDSAGDLANAKKRKNTSCYGSVKTKSDRKEYMQKYCAANAEEEKERKWKFTPKPTGDSANARKRKNGYGSTKTKSDMKEYMRIYRAANAEKKRNGNTT